MTDRIKTRTFTAGNTKSHDFLNGWAPAQPGIARLSPAEYTALMRIDFVEERAERNRKAPSMRKPNQTIAESAHSYYIPGDPLEGTEYIGPQVAYLLRALLAPEQNKGRPKGQYSRALAKVKQLLGTSEPLAWCSTYFDLQPDWIQQVLASPEQTYFAFAESVD